MSSYDTYPALPLDDGGPFRAAVSPGIGRLAEGRAGRSSLPGLCRKLDDGHLAGLSTTFTGDVRIATGEISFEGDAAGFTVEVGPSNGRICGRVSFEIDEDDSAENGSIINAWLAVGLGDDGLKTGHPRIRQPE